MGALEDRLHAALAENPGTPPAPGNPGGSSLEDRLKMALGANQPEPSAMERFQKGASAFVERARPHFVAGLPDPTEMGIPGGAGFPALSWENLETQGKKVKDAAKAAVGNIVENKSREQEIAQPNASEANKNANITAGAGVGAALNTAIEVAPFTPGEFTQYIGGELAPHLTTGDLAHGDLANKSADVAEAIGNKFLNTPGKVLARDQRLEAATLGKKLIDNPELNSGSREEVLAKTKAGIEQMENAIQSKINREYALQASLGGAKPTTVPDSFGVPIRVADTSGALIKRDVANEALKPMLDKYASAGANDPASLNSIREVYDSFINSSGGDTLNAPQVNMAKRNLYQKVGDANYLKQQPTVKVEAEKSLANVLRDKLGEMIPGINDINKKYGDYLAIQDALNKAIPREAKSVTGAIKGGLEQSAWLAGAKAVKALPEKISDMGLDGARGLGTLIRAGLSKKKNK